MAKQKKVIELIIDENDPMWGVQAISFVKFPAIEKNFIFMNATGKRINMKSVTLNEEKRLVYGPALIPDMEIYRRDDDGEEYYIKFSRETIRQTAHLFMRNNNHHNATVEHAYSVNGITTVETWLKDYHNDKSVSMGMRHPIGTWIVCQHVENEAVWKQIKNKEVEGFSIEGFFVEMAIKQHKQGLKKQNLTAPVSEAEIRKLIEDAYDAQNQKPSK